jgi:hypothetical protein
MQIYARAHIAHMHTVSKTTKKRYEKKRKEKKRKKGKNDFVTYVNSQIGKMREDLRSRSVGTDAEELLRPYRSSGRNQKFNICYLAIYNK